MSVFKFIDPEIMKSTHISIYMYTCIYLLKYIFEEASTDNNFHAFLIQMFNTVKVSVYWRIILYNSEFFR